MGESSKQNTQNPAPQTETLRELAFKAAMETVNPADRGKILADLYLGDALFYVSSRLPFNFIQRMN